MSRWDVREWLDFVIPDQLPKRDADICSIAIGVSVFAFTAILGLYF